MKTMKYTTADGYTFEGFMFRDTHGQCSRFRMNTEVLSIWEISSQPSLAML